MFATNNTSREQKYLRILHCSVLKNRKRFDTNLTNMCQLRNLAKLCKNIGHVLKDLTNKSKLGRRLANIWQVWPACYQTIIPFTLCLPPPFASCGLPAGPGAPGAPPSPRARRRSRPPRAPLDLWTANRNPHTWGICNNNNNNERGEQANLTGLVLSCIEAKFSKKICVGKLSPKSTQCTPLHRFGIEFQKPSFAPFCTVR